MIILCKFQSVIILNALRDQSCSFITLSPYIDLSPFLLFHTHNHAHTHAHFAPLLYLSHSSSSSLLLPLLSSFSLSLSASGISYGRIATLFLLGYELCSAFIRRHGAALFLSFIGRILNYLIRFLKDIGFFDWLVRHSWVSRSKNFLHAQSVVNSL